MACPLKSKNKRISDFVEHPNLVKAYVKHQKIFRDTHPNANVNKNTQDVYEDVYLSIFEDSLAEHNENKHTLFGDMDYKAELERIFKIKL